MSDFVLSPFHRATDRLMKDIDSLGSHLRNDGSSDDGAGNAAGLRNEEAEALFSQMKGLADSPEGGQLFEYLKNLNQVLESSGVKAFGDLDESSYKTSQHQWNIDALTEDIQACKEEMKLQVSCSFGWKAD
jgi:hypothetical protein